MADIELVIKMSEEDYKRVSTIVDMGLGTNVDEAIQGGVPLPKGHGDLIDRNELLNSSCLWEFHRYDDYSKASKIIKNIPTIIESDKENRDEG